MTNNPFLKQITNRNFLSPVGFKFNLQKKPKIDFFSNNVNLPGINLGVAMQPTPLKAIPIPGETLTFDDFSLRFVVDEDMENYIEVWNWLCQFGFPKDFSQYQQLLNEDERTPGVQNAISGMSDGTLIIYNSSYNPNIKVEFKDLFPVSLSAIQFDSTSQDITYASAEVVFKYTIYDIMRVSQ
jgi:hypothetical protein